MTKKVTLTQVAEAAGVSVASASLALNNKPGVSDATRQHILKTAAELGYRQAIHVAVPSPTQLRQVACLLRHNNADENTGYENFYNQVIIGAEQHPQYQDIDIAVYPVEVDENCRPVDYPQLPADIAFDGYILMGIHAPATDLSAIIDTSRPLVLVDAFVDGGTYDQILPDNFQGAYAATTHLIAQGHRQIGLIGYQAGCFPGIAERFRSYWQALHDHGLAPDDYVEPFPLEMTAAQEATRRLLQRAPEVTAIVACNDPAAFGVYQALYDLGLRIPDDISVVGFDNLAMSGIVSPPLTTIHIDKALMGKLAFDYLERRVLSLQETSVTTHIHVHLVARNSVRNRAT